MDLILEITSLEFKKSRTKLLKAIADVIPGKITAEQEKVISNKLAEAFIIGAETGSKDIVELIADYLSELRPTLADTLAELPQNEIEVTIDTPSTIYYLQDTAEALINKGEYLDFIVKSINRGENGLVYIEAEQEA